MKDIPSFAIQNLIDLTGIKAIWREGGALDGVLEMELTGKTYCFQVKLINSIQMHQWTQKAIELQGNERSLLLAERISPATRKEMRAKSINYFEANGNLFLSEEGLYLWIDTGAKLAKEHRPLNRAFTPTGLKVLFYLLTNHNAINFTHRVLANEVRVSLGTIPQVFEGLKQMGYVLALNKKTLVWNNKRALLHRWVELYPTVLRSKLFRGRCTFKGHWSDIALKENSSVWGGESAADLLTNQLRPEHLILYTHESQGDLMRNYRLMPDSAGEMEVLDMFWAHRGGLTAPHLLVYADLLFDGGARNRAMAQKIYDEFLRADL